MISRTACTGDANPMVSLAAQPLPSSSSMAKDRVDGQSPRQTWHDPSQASTGTEVEG